MSVSRSKRTAQNLSVGFIYQVTNMILAFVSRTVFIRTLGDEYLGLNGIFSDVLTLLSMADLGFSTAMAYSFYKPLADNDEDRIAALVAFYKKVYNTIALVVLGLGLCCIPFLRLIVNTEKQIDHLEIYYLFSLAGVVTSYLFVYKTTLLTADQKDFKVVNIRMITNFAKVVLQIVTLLIWKNYIVYLAIGTFMGILTNLIASKKAESEYPYIKDLKNRDDVDKELTGSIVENMKSVFIYKVSTTVFSATDNIIISIVISTVMVGLYSNYLMLSQKLLLIEQIVFSAMTASIGNVIAKENADKRYQIFQTIQSISFIFCGIITTGYCILANDLVRIWLGEDHMLPLTLVAAVSVNTFLSCSLQPLWSYRDASGLYKKTKYIMLIATIENIILSVILGKLMGVAGVIFASAIARLTTYFWYEPKLLYREYFERSPRSYFLAMLKNLALATVVIAVVGTVSSRFYVSSWGELIIKGAIIGVVCTIVFVGAYYKTEGAQNLIRKVKELVKR
ncbi:oligosaccharide flippase family protein [Butyrivibrio sp. MC2021]|uniref:oligosaccharide flippase family protein n=1 Tax=Butyrivibrio sp. MC2021 TaxID=1408306 RepID=UPI00047B7C62|nr:oligosaccharide flippase family protein [Butyrivibrio sp. MC2021]